MKSAWEIDDLPEFTALSEDANADVCIVGGGLAGLWCAYLLSNEGQKVILLEKDKLARAATLYTTGFVTEVVDTDLSDLIRIYGEDGASLAWKAGEEAIELIERVVQEEAIDCEFLRLPFYSFAADAHDLSKLKEEVAAAEKVGLKARIVGPLEGFKNVGAMEVPNQAKYHAVKFFWGLVAAAKKNGIKFYEHTEVSKVGKGLVETKAGPKVRAEAVVIATYEPLGNPKQTHWKKGMYTSYVYELEVGKGTFADGIYEDQMNPYHYFRFDNLEDRERVIVGGEDHRAELDFEGGRSFKALHEFIDKTFPHLKYEIKSKWSGGILESSDGLPLIGEYEQDMYLTSAFSGNGMTYSAISGKILTDLILGRGSKYKDLYDPKRSIKPKAFLQKFLDYGGEFLGGALKNFFK